MKQVVLGKTGLKVNKLGFGGIPIQRGDAERAKEVFDSLIENGIDYVDTARGYTVSEEYIGYAAEGRRDRFILATKSMSRDYESMKRDIETSLKNFRTDHIDLYQFHNVPPADIEKIFGPDGAYKALLEARTEGKVLHIGYTTHKTETMEKMLEEHPDEMETVMFPYNLVEIHGEELLRKCKEKGIGTIAMKPLAGGNLDDYKLAMRFIDQSDCIDVIIPGMGDPEEVEANAEALRDDSPLTNEELAEIERIRRELGTRFCRRCGYCAPCTVGIVIPNLFLLANYKRKYKLGEWAQNRYDATPIKASACVECGACESRCPYDLPIREMLKDVVKLME